MGQTEAVTLNAPVGVRLCRHPCKPLGSFLSFLPEISLLHLLLGLWDCGQREALSKRLVGSAKYCPSGRQIHSPQDWHSRGKERKIFLALPESPHICRALHSPRGLSGAVVMDGVVRHPGTLHERLPWCVHRDGRAAAMSERSP